MLRIQNSYGKRYENFIPWDEQIVSMYVCGPTVYDYTHIGHARTFVVFDSIRRYLSLKGYNVTYVQNITDIDDKIINKANELRTSWDKIADSYTKDYLENLNRLNIRIDLHPRVTQHINEIINFIQGLIDKGFAYMTKNGSVYFNVDKYPNYGRLSGNFNKNLWNQGEEIVSEKKNPYDFALWKSAKPNEPFWESPWGKGRPGWHIECSVMSSRYLGKHIDIHGGGSDLIFPHHENEIAQSEAFFNETPWVKYWLHTSMLTIKGEKMSKSLGNIISLNEAISKWGTEILRLWLLSSHYRAVIEYSEQSLNQAKKLYDRLSFISQDVTKRLRKEEFIYYLKDNDLDILNQLRNLMKNWYNSMDDDFNMSEAIRYVWDLTDLYYKYIQDNESFALISYVYSILNNINKVYGVLDKTLEKEFLTIQKNYTPELIDLLLEVRKQLREKKMYDLSDQI
ncbi:MAG: cysteine--tRNA ligase, partial [Caldisphaera sp.]|nr:cysteine--tRNA ligase [Caldisphaera sp.]